MKLQTKLLSPEMCVRRMMALEQEGKEAIEAAYFGRPLPGAPNDMPALDLLDRIGAEQTRHMSAVASAKNRDDVAAAEAKLNALRGMETELIRAYRSVALRKLRKGTLYGFGYRKGQRERSLIAPSEWGRGHFEWDTGTLIADDERLSNIEFVHLHDLSTSDLAQIASALQAAGEFDAVREYFDRIDIDEVYDAITWPSPKMPPKERLEAWLRATIARKWDLTFDDWYIRALEHFDHPGWLTKVLFRELWNAHATDEMKKPGRRPTGYAPPLE